ncbi:MAG: 4-alpha-glucanotransferase [Acidobacteria bacterium]|nr:4-alpha-glucanotransferase [Acidobacteriota bacterium]
MSYSEALERAASLWGVEPAYWDIWGKRHETQPEVQKAILRGLGVCVDSQESVDAAVEARLCEDWARLTPSTIVIGEKDSGFPVAIPAGSAGDVLHVEIRWEDGGLERYDCSPGQLEPAETAELRGERYERRMAILPARLPLGYHELRVSTGAFSSVTRLIVSPDRAWLPQVLAEGGRAAGVAISLYGLRSRRNWGCGDFTDLERIVDWVAEDLGAAFIALNPLHAIHNRQPFNTSPYLPNSVFYRNPIYLDIERLEDFQRSEPAQAMFSAPETQAEIAALRASSLIEYERVHALKLRFLRLCFETFLRRRRRDPSRGARFEEYCQREGELLDRYATYCALDEWIHELHPEIWIWPDWPSEYRDPQSQATRRFQEERGPAVLLHKYVQWQLDEQLGAAQRYAIEKGLSIGLYHDLALATDSCGSDLWAHRPFFVSGCRVGSPPDDFSPQGQDWGFPPPNAERHREDGYRLFAESIRHNSRHAGALRIDHVMRFFRLFWIPDGVEAADGTYVREFHRDLLRILALESVRQKVLIVGEDLGTVEPEMRETLARFGIMSCRLLYFERSQNGEFRLPEEYPRQALVSSATHDLATLAGFWLNRDIEARHNAGLLGDGDAYRAQLEARVADKQKILDALFKAGLLPDWFPRSASEVPELVAELHSAIIGFLASTPSMLMLLNQEDLTKETEQQNLPGSTWQYPNWRRKMKFTVEELRFSALAHDCGAMFRDWLDKTGRRGY